MFRKYFSSKFFDKPKSKLKLCQNGQIHKGKTQTLPWADFKILWDLDELFHFVLNPGLSLMDMEIAGLVTNHIVMSSARV